VSGPRVECRARPAATLVELLVTLSIMGVIASVATMAARRFDVPRANDPLVVIKDSLRRAIDSNRTVTVRLVVDGIARSFTAHADGSVVADSALQIERFTGRAANAR
jgi:prepilin-type N-terminal cleavage/methylation domain-containing protein